MRHRIPTTTLLLAAIACGGAEPAVQAPATASAAASPTAPAAQGAAGASRPETAMHTPVAPVPLEEYFKIQRVPPMSRSGLPMLSFSADERKVAFATDLTGRIDIWVRDLATAPTGAAGAAGAASAPGASGSAPVQVSHVEGFVHSFAFSPKEDLLVFEADRGGDELPRLYATDSKGAPARELVPELPSGRRTQFVEWAHDGQTFMYLSNARDEKSMDLAEYDVRTKKSAIVWEASGSLGLSNVSRDHKRFAIMDTHSDANTDLWLGIRGKKELALLTKHEGNIIFGSATFSPNGDSLFVLSDEGSEFTELFSMSLAKVQPKDAEPPKRTPLLHEKWDVESADFSSTGKYFSTVVNENGTPKLIVTGQGKPIVLPAPPGKASAWRLLAFSKSDRFVGLSLASDAMPVSSYVADLQSGTLTQLSDPLPASLKTRAMVVGESVSIPSFDGKSIPAFLYRPAGPGPFPAIIEVHGGPTAQSTRSFATFGQYNVSKCYAVLYPNVRGSTGYGKSYTRLDNLDLGGGPLKDIVACKRWLVEHARVSADKVVVMGGSYGGYMALVAEAFAPDEFAANVDFFGVSDLKTLVESFPAYWASSASYIYQKFGDPKNPAHASYQHDRSPIHFTSQMKRPLLIVQGDKDARVKKDQSDRIASALKQQKTPVHYLVLENEGHGFSKTENNLRALRLTDRFLDRYIFGDTSITDLP
jgi:dipeptidyl aminopeptidase/acylaminoacyl peptidase